MVSEHANGTGHKPLWNAVKFIDRDNHWCTAEEAVHIRLKPNNINRDNGAEIPETSKAILRFKTDVVFHSDFFK